MAAESIAAALNGRKVGSGWMARCPAHDDRTPSLSIATSSDGRVLLCCHAGCEQQRVIDSLQELGLWPAQRIGRVVVLVKSQHSQSEPNEHYDAERTQRALRIWRASKPASGTPAETYLLSRGLNVSAPPSLRFHGALNHPSRTSWPAMVAVVARGEDNEPLGIHRTFLARDGVGKASIEPNRMMLGPCRGGAVRLASQSESLMVGEGIETCLAAMQATGLPAWAALSTSGLRSLNLPQSVTNVIVLADGDDPGEAAARDCALRWKREGRDVRIARPPRGSDFNDVLLRSYTRTEGGGV